ncbi:hypothetical protein GCM10023334_122570 [Nonomuraea thailandensis]
MLVEGAVSLVGGWGWRIGLVWVARESGWATGDGKADLRGSWGRLREPGGGGEGGADQGEGREGRADSGGWWEGKTRGRVW